MKLTKNNLTKKLGETNSEVIDIVTKYNKLLPILSEDGEGFCVNARDLHEQLVENSKEGKKGTEFAKWIKRRIDKYNLIENIDYKTIVKFDEAKFLLDDIKLIL